MSTNGNQDTKLFTVKEVAHLLKVSVQTVKNYIYQGKLRSLKTPGGHHRILQSELSKQFSYDTCVSPKTVAEKGSSQKFQGIATSTKLVQAIIRTIEKKENPLYFGHAFRVSQLAQKIGNALKLNAERVQCLEMAASLHDIGKLNIGDAILSKTGSLSSREYEEIKKHPQFGAEIVNDIDYLQSFAPIIRHHHEWFNGSGYPDKLCGENIPLDAQIIGIAEAYDVISARFKEQDKENYREKSLAELGKVANIQFSPVLINILKEVIAFS